MKKNVKNIAIVGGALTVLFLLYKQYNKKPKLKLSKGGEKATFKPPKTTKPPKREPIETPTPTPPFIPQSSGGGTGGMVTNNQTVPQNYNPRDYGDIVLGNVDRRGNIRR